MKNKKQKDLLQLAVGLVLLVAINVLASYKFERLDLTAEKRYSLSDSTKTMLRNLEDVALVTVYLEGDQFPVGFKRLRNATEEVLSEFRYYAGGNFEYRFIDPFGDPDPVAQKELYLELTSKGLVPTNLMVKDKDGQRVRDVFPGAVVSYNGHEVPVQLLKSQYTQNSEMVLNQSIEYLEYEFAKALYKLKYFQKKKQVAFTRGHGELNERYLVDIINELKEFYDVIGIEIKNDLDLLNSQTDAIIVAQPDTAFDDASKFILDQYIMNGGRSLWLMDNVFASMDSMGGGSYTLGIPNDLNLYDQFFKYGVRINPTLVQDAQCAPIKINTGNFGTQAQEDLHPWFYYPVIIPESKHMLVRNVNTIKLEFANTIDTIAVPGVKKTILLSTSDLTKVLYAPVRIALNIIEQTPTAEKFNKPKQTVGVLLEGEFRSVFENRIVPKTNREVRDVSVPTKMIVVSDGDIIKNAFNPATNDFLPLGLDRTSGIYYSGNKTFILNAVNYLTDDAWFVPLRSKEFRIRLLNKPKVAAEKTSWILLNVLFPIFFVAIFGVIYNIIRKRRFASVR